MKTFDKAVFDKELFAQQVYEITRLIPKGRVTSYGAIAEALEEKRRVRMVGWALTQCPDDVPAHRVVNRNGVLTGRAFFGGNRMQELLKEDGVDVLENKVKDFKKIVWFPLLEL